MATISDTYKIDSKADTGGIKSAQGALGGLGSALKSVAKIGAAPFRAIGGAISAIGKGMAVFGLAAQGLKIAADIVGKVSGALKEASPAFGKALGRIEERFSNFKDILFRNIGDALAPLLNKLADILGSPQFTEFFNQFSTFVFGALKTAGPILMQVVDWLGGVVQLFSMLLGGQLSPAAFINSVVTGFLQLLGVSDETANGIGDTLGGAFGSLVAFAQDAIPKVIAFVGQVVTFVQTNWPKVQAIFESVFGKVGAVIGAVAKVIGGFIAENGPAIEAFLTNTVGKVGEILGKLWEIVSTILGKIAVFINENQQGIRQVIETVWALIQTSIDTVLKVISGVINVALDILNGNWAKAWADFKKIFDDVWNGFVGIVTNVWNLIKGVVRDGINAVIDFINNNLIYGINQAVIAANRTLGTSFHGVDPIPRVSFAKGGIAYGPVPAIVGDARSPEAVAPLADLLPMIQQAVRATPVQGNMGAISVTVSVGNVTIANGADQDSFLRSIAAAAEQGLRQALGQSTRYPLGLARSAS